MGCCVKLGVIVAAVLPVHPVLAEGGRIVLTCSVGSDCNLDQFCNGVTFVLSPSQVAADGSGTFGISYNGHNYAANNLTASGPLVWTEVASVEYRLSPANADGDGRYALEEFHSDRNTPFATLDLTCEVS